MRGAQRGRSASAPGPPGRRDSTTLSHHADKCCGNQSGPHHSGQRQWNQNVARANATPSDPDPCRREIDMVACPSCCVGSRRSTACEQGSHHRPYTCTGWDRGQAVREQGGVLVDQPCGLRGHAEAIERPGSRASLPPENRTSNSARETTKHAPAGADCQEPLTAPQLHLSRARAVSWRRLPRVALGRRRPDGPLNVR